MDAASFVGDSRNSANILVAKPIISVHLNAPSIILYIPNQLMTNLIEKVGRKKEDKRWFIDVI